MAGDARRAEPLRPVRHRRQRPRVVRRLARARLLLDFAREQPVRAAERGPPRVAWRVLAARRDHQPDGGAEQARSVFSVHRLWIPSRTPALVRRSRSRSRAASATPAGARSSSAAGCATACSGGRRRTSTSKSTASPAPRLRELLAAFGSVNAVGESFTVYKVAGDRRGASPPRIEDRPRASRLRGHGRSGPVARGGGAPARLHHQRHRVGSADRRVHRPVRRPRAISRHASCARSIPATFGDDSLRVLRAVQFAARFELALDAGHRASSAGRIPLDDLPAGTRLGRNREAAAAGARGRRSGCDARARPRGHRPAVPGAAGARRLPAGAGVASRGGRLGAHADGRSTRRARASTTSSARSRLP